MMNGTTVPLSQETKQDLVGLKNHPQETFDKLFQRIVIYMRNDEEDLLTKEDLADIKKSIEGYEKGKFKTQAQMKKKFGLK